MEVSGAKKEKQVKDLAGILKIVERKKVPRRLSFIYQQVPDFFCDRCSECCFSCCETYFLEFLTIYAHLKQLPKEEQEPIVKRLVQYELFSLMALDYQCPFLEFDGKKGSCVLYDTRPLACRFFGLYPEDDYRDMRLKSRQANEELTKFYSRSYGLFLPDSVMGHDVDQCEYGQDEEGNSMALSYYERGRLQRLIVQLEDDTIPTEVGRLKEETQRFSYLFVRTFFSDHEFFNLKLGLMRRFKEGLDQEEIDDISEKIISQYRIKL